uniref:G protein beta subunit Gib2 n=1 Tax=Ganoderma boninense TaxID=34458 RepID=A0A5K1K0T3_9APHY|nr:G protein beta subunit Gib2 [Ganoderma boninense]
MSFPLDPTRIVAVQDAHFTANLITVGIAALVGYDYLLTVERESRLFWRRKVNTATILFFANRYLALLYYVGLAYYRCLSLPFLE